MSPLRTPAARALAADTGAVLLFVLVGRRNHDESSAIVGVLSTAWPFLTGLAAGWLAARAWRRPLRLLPEAAIIWLVTVAVGMALRAVTGAGTATPFVLVALIVLGTLLLGWRAVSTFVSQRRAPGRVADRSRS